MPAAALLVPPAHVLLKTPPQGKTFGHAKDVQLNQTSDPAEFFDVPEHSLPPPVPHTANSYWQPQSATDHDSDVHSDVPQSAEVEDEHTLSAYGDISLSEVMVLPLPTSLTCSDVLRPRVPQPRLRPKVQRPPMPKRRLSHYDPYPSPYSGGPNLDEDCPRSPRPIANRSPWTPHQSLVSPHVADPTDSWTQESMRATRKGGLNLEDIFDELLPRSPSIRLSPPGSPANQALGLPQNVRAQRRGGGQGGIPPKMNDAKKLPQSPPAAAPQQNKPWRTRLPPRPPIPKWDV